jgi:flavin-dependent dehydrogenase
MGAGRSAADVAVIGGGPAGTAAALSLLRYTRHRVVVVEGTRYELPRIGETVSAAVLPLLDYLGVLPEISTEHRLEAFSTQAAWGSSDLSTRDFVFTGRGNSWHLDRRRFDATLAEAVTARGGTVLRGTWLRSADFARNTWRLRFSGASGVAELHARQVIDATGRRAIFARHMGAKRLVYDQMVGIAGYFDLGPNVTIPQVTLVESVPNGWWYSAPLPGRLAVATFMTDLDELRSSQMAQSGVFRRRLSNTLHIATRLAEAKLVDKPRVYPAGSHQLSPCLGAAWVAAGDAAAAFDPLSSLGIGHAIASGIQAARIASQRLKGKEELASCFQADIARHVNSFLAQRASYYAYERRWPASPFWSRRQISRGTPRA